MCWKKWANSETLEGEPRDNMTTGTPTLKRSCHLSLKLSIVAYFKRLFLRTNVINIQCYMFILIMEHLIPCFFSFLLLFLRIKICLRSPTWILLNRIDPLLLLWWKWMNWLIFCKITHFCKYFSSIFPVFFFMIFAFVSIVRRGSCRWT